jgi:hypothetical protein
VVFDLEDLDRDSVVGFGDFDVQLLWWCLDPVIATPATVLAFVECLDSCAGSEVLKILELVLLGWAILMCGESRDVRRGDLRLCRVRFSNRGNELNDVHTGSRPGTTGGATTVTSLSPSTVESGVASASFPAIALGGEILFRLNKNILPAALSSCCAFRFRRVRCSKISLR